MAYKMAEFDPSVLAVSFWHTPECGCDSAFAEFFGEGCLGATYFRSFAVFAGESSLKMEANLLQKKDN